MDEKAGVFQKKLDLSSVHLPEVITTDSWKSPFDHFWNTKALLCSQRAGCNRNTQIFVEVERVDVTCLGNIVDDESIRLGAYKGTYERTWHRSCEDSTRLTNSLH